MHEGGPADKRISSRLIGLAETLLLLVGASLLAGVLASVLGLPTRAERDVFLFGMQPPDWLGAAGAEAAWLSWRHGLTFALIVALCLWRGGPTLRAAGLSRGGHSPTELARFGLGLFLIGMLPVFVIRTVHHFQPLGANTPFWDLMNRSDWSPAFWLYMAVSSFALVPVVEELFFRGYALARYRENLSAGGAIILTAIFFWVSHGQYLRPDFYLLFFSAMTLVTSLLFGWVVVRTGSLIPVLIAHALLNVPTGLAADLTLLAIGLAVLLLHRRVFLACAADFVRTLRGTTEWGYLLAVAAGLFALVTLVRSERAFAYPLLAAFLALTIVGVARRAPVRTAAAGVLALVALLAWPTGAGAQAPERLLITNVRILAPDASGFGAPTSILVERGRIRAISSRLRAGRGLRRIDGRGLYAIPGLWDLHVHVVGNSDDPAERMRGFRQLVAHGVTGVRDMNGVLPIAEARRLRDAVERGEIVGPRFLYPGPIVDGTGRAADQRSARVLEVADPAAARAAVARLASEGADFIKPYNRLDAPMLAALAVEARRRGLPVWGHVPHLVHPGTAAAAGQRSIEHMGNVIEAGARSWDDYHALMRRLAPAAAAGRPPAPADLASVFALRQAPNQSFDPARADALFDAFRRNGAAWVPTLVSERAVLRAHFDPAFANDPRLRTLPPAVAEAWRTEAARAPGRFGRNLPQSFFEERERLMYRAVGQAIRRGVEILPGTDTGALYAFPGSSLHDELELLVGAGMTSRQALLAATRRAAAFLGFRDSGVIRAGARADILLLRADPLARIGNTRAIEAVILNGRPFDRAALDRLAGGE